MAVLEQRLSCLHACIDAFKRCMEDRLSSTQTPDMTIIRMEIQQLREELGAVVLALLTIPMLDITILVLNLFADKPTAHTSSKR